MLYRIHVYCENSFKLSQQGLSGITLMCLNIGTPQNVNFPFGTNGKLMVLGVPILKHFKVHKICLTELILLSARFFSLQNNQNF